MVNPLARANMKRYLKDSDSFQTSRDESVKNLDSNESKLIQRIIQGDGKVASNTSRTLTLDEAVERIKNRH